MTRGAGAFEQPVISHIGPAQGEGVSGNVIRVANGDADRLSDRGDPVVGGATGIEGGEASEDSSGGKEEGPHDLDFADGSRGSGP